MMNSPENITFFAQTNIEIHGQNIGRLVVGLRIYKSIVTEIHTKIYQFQQQVVFKL